VIIQAGLYFAHFLPETKHNTQLVRLDPEEAGKSPERENTERNESEPAAAQVAAWQYAPQSVLATAQDFL
jgi:hypothetical protein